MNVTHFLTTSQAGKKTKTSLLLDCASLCFVRMDVHDYSYAR